MPKVSRYPPDDQPPPPEGGLLLLIQQDPILWLCSVDLPTEPASKLRIACYPEDVYFETDSLGQSVRYYAGAFSLGDMRADTEGSTPTTKITVQNLTREWVAAAENYDLTGMAVRLVCIQLGELAGPSPTPISDYRFEVLEVDTAESTVELKLGIPGMLDREIPDRRITRDHCAQDFGGVECGYDTTAVGALQTCSKLLDGDLGCIAHANQNRFLGFKGVPRESGVGVT